MTARKPPVFCLTALRNEASLAPAFLAEAAAVLSGPGMAGRARLVVVDDGSTDGSAEALGREAAKRQGLPLEVMRLDDNRGNQAALAWGLRALLPRLEGAHLVTFDPDGEDDLARLPELVAMLDEDPGRMVFVTRESRSEGLVFRLFYRAYRVFYRLLTGQRVIPCNMMALPWPLSARLAGSPLISLHFSYPALRLGLPHRVLPVARRRRYGGASSQDLDLLIQHGLIGLTIFYEHVVARLILLSGAAVAFTGLVSAWILFMRFLSPWPPPMGLATAMFVSLLGFAYMSVVLLVVFCLATSILRLLSEAQRR